MPPEDVVAAPAPNQTVASLAERLAQHRDALLTALAGATALLGFLAERRELPALAIALYLISYLSGGLDTARAALTTLVRQRQLDVDLLMIVAAIGAAAIGYWSDGALLIFIFSLSGTLEGYAQRRTERALTALLSLAPETARVWRGGAWVERPLGEVEVGDRLLVTAGERIGADGVVLDGRSSVDQSSLTGESMPVEREVGDPVLAGTVNLTGAIQVRVDRLRGDTVIGRMIRMVEEAVAERPPAQLFIERFEHRYARFVVAGALAVALSPPWLFGWSWETALYRSMIFLVVASPCALVVSMMPTLLSGLAHAARKGILFKRTAYLEMIGRIDAIAFDKTGTLTLGKPRVERVVALTPGSEEAVLAAAASLETLSQHPLARAIVDEAMARGVQVDPVSELTDLTGLGLRGLLGGQAWLVGRPKLFAERGLAIPEPLAAAARELAGSGHTVVLVGPEDEGPRGLIALRDQIRPEAPTALAELRRLGVKHMILITGDNPESAAAIGRELGMDEVHAGLLPADKVAHVRELAERFGQVAMVGDGVNDAPALATASLGIAMGKIGTDVALETADIVLTSDQLSRLAYAIRLGRRANRLTRANLAFALSVIVFLTVNALLGGLNLPLGVVGHEGSTVLVTLNGLRMLRGAATD